MWSAENLVMSFWCVCSIIYVSKGQEHVVCVTGTLYLRDMLEPQWWSSARFNMNNTQDEQLTQTLHVERGHLFPVSTDWTLGNHIYLFHILFLTFHSIFSFCAEQQCSFRCWDQLFFDFPLPHWALSPSKYDEQCGIF